MNGYDVANILSAIADAGMLILLFEAFLQHRRQWTVWWLVLDSILLAGAIVVCNHFLMFHFGNVVGLMLVALIASCIYVAALWQRMIVIVIGLLIGLMSEVLIVSVLAAILHKTAEAMIHIPDYRLMGVLFAKILALAICNGIRVFRQRRQVDLGKNYWLIFLLQYVSFIIIAFLMFRLSYALEATTYNMAVVFGVVCLLLSITFSLFIYERQNRQSAMLWEKEQHEQQLKLQLKHLDEILARQMELRKFKHDISNQMIGLQGHLQVNDTAGAMQYIATFDHHLQTAMPSFETGNIALDAVLSTKKALAESKGITFDAKLRIVEDLPIADEDICIIFGNALDNAIEACEQLEDAAERYINLSLVQVDALLLCKIKNTAPPRQVDDLATTKTDQENHGFGLQNLTESLASYDSEPDIVWQNGMFILSFMLPLSK